MKVLFLDFDGVLNSEKWFRANILKIQSQSGLLWRHQCELDPECLARVTRIIEDTQCKVVVSSSWRIGMSVQELQECLKAAGGPVIADAIIDTTPTWSEIEMTIKGRTAIRGDEVQAWLDEHLDVERHVILDDDSDFLEGQPLVQTSWSAGITEMHVLHAKEILNGPSP